MAGFDPRVLYSDSGQPYQDGALYDGFEYKGPNNGPWYVEIAFDLAANGVGNWFTLDDPVKGVLDNATYLLSGELLVDVTRYVQSIKVKRGRSRLLEKYITGQCEVVLNNMDRIFDPTMTGSPFYGQTVPGKQIRITYDSYPVFVGTTSDWDYDYELPRYATATVKSLDGFSIFSNQYVPAQTMTQQLTGARINKVLDDIGWPAERRSIDAGSASVGADVVPDNTNALSYLQKVELSQAGRLFMTRDGLVRFDVSVEQPTYTIGEGGIPFVKYDVIYGIEEMYNKVNVEYLVGGVTGYSLTAESASSQAAYGVYEETLSTLLSGSAAASTLANSFVSAYKNPTYRVNSVEFNFRALGTDDQAKLMDIELGELADLRFTPSQVGEQIFTNVMIDSIEHNVTPRSHTVTMALTDLGVLVWT